MIETFEAKLPHGITLNCRVSGREGAPVLVFMHGFPEAAFVWDELLEHFADRYRCVAPNLRGFGPSSSPSEPEFVSPGDEIDVKQTLGLLEAMKVFQSVTLESYRSGGAPLYTSKKYQVVRVVPENGQNVNLGDLLFVIRPAQSASENE